MTKKLALPTLIAICSIALNKPVISSAAILGEISISGTMLKVDELANSLQVCLDSGAKKVLLPITSAGDLGSVPAELIGCFNFYISARQHSLLAVYYKHRSVCGSYRVGLKRFSVNIYIVHRDSLEYIVCQKERLDFTIFTPSILFE